MAEGLGPRTSPRTTCASKPLAGNRQRWKTHPLQSVMCRVYLHVLGVYSVPWMTDVVALAGKHCCIGVLCTVLFCCLCGDANPACWLRRQDSGETSVSQSVTTVWLSSLGRSAHSLAGRSLPARELWDPTPGNWGVVYCQLNSKFRGSCGFMENMGHG